MLNNVTDWYVQLSLVHKILWAANLLVIFEAYTQLRPLYVLNIPIPSRKSYIYAMLKYGIGVFCNVWLMAWPMVVWLGVGFLKEFLGWIKLVELKQGMEDEEFCDYFDDDGEDN